MQTGPRKLLLEFAVASLLIVGFGVFMLAGGPVGNVIGLVIIAGALIGGAVLDQRGAINIGVAISAAIGTVVVVGVLIVGLISLAVYSMFSGGGSGLTYVNKTTVPIAVVDRDSRSIVGACSERTIGWSNSWGGDPSTGTPRAEPLPADAFVVSVEGYRPAVDAAMRVTFVVTRVRIAEVREGMADPRNLPCEGVPPGWRSPSASPSAPASAPPSTK